MPKVNSRSLRFTERHATKYAASLLFIGLSLPAAALADERYDALIRQAGRVIPRRCWRIYHSGALRRG